MPLPAWSILIQNEWSQHPCSRDKLFAGHFSSSTILLALCPRSMLLCYQAKDHEEDTCIWTKVDVLPVLTGWTMGNGRLSMRGYEKWVLQLGLVMDDLEEFEEAESCFGLNAVRKWGVGQAVILCRSNLMNLFFFFNESYLGGKKRAQQRLSLLKKQ